MTDDIFDRLEARANTPRPAPPLPSHLDFTADQLRSELAATLPQELQQLVDQVEDTHHAYLLERWAEEQQYADLHKRFDGLLDQFFGQFKADASAEHAEEEEAARERARNRGTSTGSGPIATLSGDDEQLAPPCVDDEVQQAFATRHLTVGRDIRGVVYVDACNVDFESYAVVVGDSNRIQHVHHQPRQPSMCGATIVMVVQVVALVVVFGMAGASAATAAAVPAAFGAMWAIATWLPNRPVFAAGRLVSKRVLKWLLTRGRWG
jgi:hypothetical protein